LDINKGHALSILTPKIGVMEIPAGLIIHPEFSGSKMSLLLPIINACLPSCLNKAQKYSDIQDIFFMFF